MGEIVSMWLIQYWCRRCGEWTEVDRRGHLCGNCADDLRQEAMAEQGAAAHDAVIQ